MFNEMALHNFNQYLALPMNFRFNTLKSLFWTIILLNSFYTDEGKSHQAW